MSAWIEMVPVDQAEGPLKDMFAAVTTPHGTVDNVMRVHSLRPHTMDGHRALYKAALHHPDNVLPFWLLEAIGTWTSILNGCDYSVAHHLANFRRLLGDDPDGEAKCAALEARNPAAAFEGKELALLRYAGKLTADPAGMDRADYDVLREAGCSDGEILEANQVCGYFNYVNRHLNGLGVTTEGDVIGYYTGDPSNGNGGGEAA